ncbi:MAG: hypothetical protein IKF36_04670 [Bacilli bacterium]|nr:hypothetical protein [Bacilli bacterium]
MEIIEYEFGTEKENYLEWIKNDKDGLGYFADGRSILSRYIYDIDRIFADSRRNHADHEEYSSLKVFENGVVLSFHAGSENYNWGDYDPVVAHAIIYDTGEIHYVITNYATSSTKTNDELYDQLVDRLGSEVLPTSSNSLFGTKKEIKVNDEVRQVIEAKAKTVLGNIREQLDAEKEDVSEEEKMIITMADYLNKEGNLLEIEKMKMILRAMFGNQEESRIDKAIIKHLNYTGEVLAENKKISKIQEQQRKIKGMKSA